MASARGDSSVGGQGDTRTGVDEPADVSPSILHNRDKVLRHLRIHPGNRHTAPHTLGNNRFNNIRAGGGAAFAQERAVLDAVNTRGDRRGDP